MAQQLRGPEELQVGSQLSLSSVSWHVGDLNAMGQILPGLSCGRNVNAGRAVRRRSVSPVAELL